MAIIQNTYTGNGSTTNYSFTFEYLEQDDVKVTLDNVATTEFTFANATTIAFTTAPASDVAIRIYRDTDVDSLSATFFPGSAIKAEDLNENFFQNNYAVQEIVANTWDKDADTVKSTNDWTSNDTRVATTAAIDARFQDELGETLTSAETWEDDDDSIATTQAISDEFRTIVQSGTPSGDYPVGKSWLQNDTDLTYSVYTGESWLAVASGGTFVSQPKVIYVDTEAGSDESDGHRVSRPKQTIRAAVNQINAEISVSITNAGSEYTAGTYTTVSLTGGNATGLTADIVVGDGGTVTSVTVNNTTTLENYDIGDVLSAAVADIGTTGSGLEITVGGTGDGQTIIVSAGVYQETAPIQMKRRNLSIIGQSLRSCIVHPTVATETNNLFEVSSGSFIQNLTFLGVKAGTGTGNTLDAVLPETQGWNVAFYNNAMIAKSPYIQNCTNFSDSEIDNSDLRAHNPRGGIAGDTTSAPTGGGLCIDGGAVNTNSPLRSMVADSYTQVCLNGPGILVTNNGFTQCTSSYAFFNRYHIKALNGGQANLAASTTDFGNQALVADGQSSVAVFTSNIDGAVDDESTTFNINAPTRGTVWHGTATKPQENMLVTVNSITYPVLSSVERTDTEGNAGWTVTISRPLATARATNQGVDGAIDDDAAVSFFLRSQIASSGHTMEYVGSGTNYNALPENGGVPNDDNQIVEANNGRVWTAITDHNGRFSVGDFFTVDQRTGAITMTGGSFATEIDSDQSPQLGGDLDTNEQSIVTVSNRNIVLDPNGTGTVDVSTSRITNLADPVDPQDAATRQSSEDYADAVAGNRSVFMGFRRVTAGEGNDGSMLQIDYSEDDGDEATQETFDPTDFIYKDTRHDFLGASNLLHALGDLQGIPKIAFNTNGHLIITLH